jgi:hypothetical protein
VRILKHIILLLITLAASINLFNLCSVSVDVICVVEPVNVAHCGGKTEQNSYKFILKDSRAPKSKAHISRCTPRAFAILLADPPPHFAVPPTVGPKKTASIALGELMPRQFNFPLLHGFPLRGVLSNTENFVY